MCILGVMTFDLYLSVKIAFFIIIFLISGKSCQIATCKLRGRMDTEIFQLNKIQNDPTIIYFNIPDILQTVPDINSLTITVKHFFPRWKDIP